MIRHERQALLSQSLEGFIELIPDDRRGIGRFRIGIERYPEEVGHPTKRQVAAAYAVGGLWVLGAVDGGEEEGGAIEDGSGRGDPGMLRQGRSEEHDRGERSVRLGDVQEPLLPSLPQTVEAIQPVHAPRAL